MDWAMFMKVVVFVELQPLILFAIYTLYKLNKDL